VTSYVPTPTWNNVPYYSTITLEGPTPQIPYAPTPGCSDVPTTQHTDTITEATYTSTITEAPDGVVTVYADTDGQQYTYGASTIFEVYIYTTTQSIDVIGTTIQCNAKNKRRRATRTPRTAAALAVPAYVEVTPTPVA